MTKWFVVVLACDMPRAGLSLPSLFEALQSDRLFDGARLVDERGRPENLPRYAAGPLCAGLWPSDRDPVLSQCIEAIATSLLAWLAERK